MHWSVKTDKVHMLAHMHGVRVGGLRIVTCEGEEGQYLEWRAHACMCMCTRVHVHVVTTGHVLSGGHMHVCACARVRVCMYMRVHVHACACAWHVPTCKVDYDPRLEGGARMCHQKVHSR